MTEGLKARAIRASIWSVGGKFAGQAFRLGSNLIMTRLLAPEMFGVMAVAFIFLTAIEMFSDVGLRQVVIKSSRGDDQRFLNTVWTIQVVRGVILGFVCLVVAGVVWSLNHARWIPPGSTYAHPSLAPVLAVLSLSAVFTGFESTKSFTASRRLAVNQVVLIEIAAQVIAFVPMVLIALAAPTIYALVTGLLCSAMAQTLLGHACLPGARNRFDWDRNSLNEVRTFGRWIMVTSGLGFVMRLGDRVLLGGMLAAPMMGLYSIACIMVGVPQQLAERLIYNIALPVLSEIQRTDPARLKSVYYRIRLPVDALCLTSGGAIFACASSIIDVLYDDRYLEAGPMLQTLSLVLFTSRFAVANQFYLVLDRQKLVAQLQLIRLLAMACFIPLGFSMGGVMGAIWGVALAPLPDSAISVLVVGRRLRMVSFRKEALHLAFIALGLGIGFGIVWLLGSLGLVKA